MTDPTPAQILSINPEAKPTEDRKTSIGWTVFWLVAFTPLGWYFVWQKTAWRPWVKLAVILLTAALFLGLLIESELIANQIATGLIGQL